MKSLEAQRKIEAVALVREEYERDKQYNLQQDLVQSQLKQRKTNYTFDALKTFVEQVGVVLIIILTAYLVLDQQMTIGAIMFLVTFGLLCRDLGGLRITIRGVRRFTPSGAT